MVAEILDDKGLTDMEVIRNLQKIYHPVRLAILKILKEHGEAWFPELKRDLRLTDGNLATHLRVLEDLGFVERRKELFGMKLRTSYVLTKQGLRAMRDLGRVFGEYRT
jgi:DNA-binding MarR family transcriptional regulator